MVGVCAYPYSESLGPLLKCSLISLVDIYISFFQSIKIGETLKSSKILVRFLSYYVLLWDVKSEDFTKEGKTSLGIELRKHKPHTI